MRPAGTTPGPDFRVETWREPGASAWTARLTPIRPEAAPFGDFDLAVVETRPGLGQAVRAAVQRHLAAQPAGPRSTP